MRQFDSAVEYYESAIALVPDMREAWQGLLKVELYGMGSIDGAREIADRWPGEDPSRYLDISRLERDRAGYLAAAEALAPSDRIARLVKYAHIGTAREWLGDMGEAIRAAEAMVSFSPEDRFGGPVWKENRALLYTRAGEVERAIDLLEGLLETPYLGPSLAGFPITRRSLRMGPEWDPLREHPRFQSLISE